ncbi:MAG: hypothetical protein U0841_04960 [Chloroflexia bacterium]
MQQEPERQHDEQPEELTETDLAAENAAELPDREAMSLVSPSSGLGLQPGPTLWPGPLPMDTTQPIEP